MRDHSQRRARREQKVVTKNITRVVVLYLFSSLLTWRKKNTPFDLNYTNFQNMSYHVVEREITTATATTTVRTSQGRVAKRMIISGEKGGLIMMMILVCSMTSRLKERKLVDVILCQVSSRLPLVRRLVISQTRLLQQHEPLPTQLLHPINQLNPL